MYNVHVACIQVVYLYLYVYAHIHGDQASCTFCLCEKYSALSSTLSLSLSLPSHPSPCCTGVYPWKKDFEKAESISINQLNKEHLIKDKVRNCL